MLPGRCQGLCPALTVANVEQWISTLAPGSLLKQDIQYTSVHLLCDSATGKSAHEMISSRRSHTAAARPYAFIEVTCLGSKGENRISEIIDALHHSLIEDRLIPIKLVGASDLLASAPGK
jgi:hypothetical protein